MDLKSLIFFFQILMLINNLMEVENDRDKYYKLVRNVREKLQEMEKERKDLVDEYVVFKINYLVFVREYEKEVSL